MAWKLPSTYPTLCFKKIQVFLEHCTVITRIQNSQQRENSTATANGSRGRAINVLCLFVSFRMCYCVCFVFVHAAFVRIKLMMVMMMMINSLVLNSNLNTTIAAVEFFCAKVVGMTSTEGVIGQSYAAPL